MKQALLPYYISLCYPTDGEADGAAKGGADSGDSNNNDAGGDKKPPEPSLRDEIDAALAVSEDKPENALSEAARTLAKSRKGKGGAPIDNIGDATIKDSERVAAENKKKMDDDAKAKAEAAAKKKRDDELAAMNEEDRKKAIAEDEKKAADTKKAADEAAQLVAPAHWALADREMFEKQSPEAKKWLLGRHKAMEGDYTRKMGEIAPQRQLLGTLDELFKPYETEMRELGVTREQAIRELVGMHARLKRDPVEGLRYLAQQCNVDLSTLTATGGEGGGNVDLNAHPIVKGLQQQVATLTENLKRMTGAQGEQQLNAALAEVTAFADEKDASGNLKRPYFNDVAGDINIRIRAARAEGRKITLQEAYDQACWADEAVRARLQTARDAERNAALEAERKRKVDEAKGASFKVSGEGSAHTHAPKSDGSVRGDLEAAFGASGERV